jgi:hypothetical protein
MDYIHRSSAFAIVLHPLVRNIFRNSDSTLQTAVYTENLFRVDDVMESPKLAE